MANSFTLTANSVALIPLTDADITNNDVKGIKCTQDKLQDSLQARLEASDHPQTGSNVTLEGVINGECNNQLFIPSSDPLVYKAVSSPVHRIVAPSQTSTIPSVTEDMRALEIREFVDQDGNVKGDVVDVMDESSSVAGGGSAGGGKTKMDNILKNAMASIASTMSKPPQPPQNEGKRWTDARMEELIRMEEEAEELERSGGKKKAKDKTAFKGLKGGFFNGDGGKKKKRGKNKDEGVGEEKKKTIRIDESKNSVQSIAPDNRGVKPPALANVSMTRRSPATASAAAPVPMERPRKSVTDGNAFTGMIMEKNVDKVLTDKKTKRKSKFARDRENAN